MQDTKMKNKKLIVSLLLLSTLSSFAVQTESSEHITDSFDNSLAKKELTSRSEQCGINSVYMCLRYFGKNVPLSKIAEKVSLETVNRGMSITELRELLNTFALEAQLISGKPNLIDYWLKENCIAIVPNKADKHFYVYLGKNKQKYLRYNPPYWKTWASFDDLQSDWQGQAVIVSNKKITNGPGISKSFFSLTITKAWVFITASIVFAILGLWFRLFYHHTTK